ncbi:hypothetical protein [Halorussus vallis]|nr:hypothetical protein [Halorussus vallis]
MASLCAADGRVRRPARAGERGTDGGPALEPDRESAADERATVPP